MFATSDPWLKETEWLKKKKKKNSCSQPLLPSRHSPLLPLLPSHRASTTATQIAETILKKKEFSPCPLLPRLGLWNGSIFFVSENCETGLCVVWVKFWRLCVTVLVSCLHVYCECVWVMYKQILWIFFLFAVFSTSFSLLCFHVPVWLKMEYKN